MARVYLSSSVADLTEYRSRVIAALRQAGHEAVAMEDYAARDERPLAACRADIEDCDLYVGILAWRYGFRPTDRNPEHLSITELEYRHAKGKPRFVFLLDEQVPWRRDLDDHITGDGDGGKCIDRFRAGLGEARWTGRFNTAEDLATQVLASIARHLSASCQPAPQTRHWLRSPYPGLVTLTADDAPIFFGRELETGELLERMNGPAGKLLVVIGASGAGKSSLIGAGLLPRLAEGAIPGSDLWAVRSFTPALHRPAALRSLADALQSEDADMDATLATLQSVGHAVDDAIAGALHEQVPGAELLLFVDQLEEVFGCEDAARFFGWLVALSRHPGVRVVATVRADLFHRCLGYPEFAAALRTAAFPLGVPSADALRQMVRAPARLAGVELSPGLVARIVADTLGDGGITEPGALALLAFALKELWQRRELGQAPTLSHYENMGGVEGVIGRRAEQIFAELDYEAQDALPGVFSALVAVSPEGVPTRRRATPDEVAGTPAAGRLVDALAAPQTRLLVRDEVRGAPLVELAHEALLSCWPRLADWIAEHAGHVQRVREVERAARGWAADPGSPDFEPWAHERQQLAYESLLRLGRCWEDEDEPLRGFLRPEAERLLQKLDDPALPALRRARIGERLAEIGDPRPGVGVERLSDGRELPDIEWVDIPGGEVQLEDGAGRFEVSPFEMARYPVTNAQFAVFVSDRGGYRDERWWHGIEKFGDGPAKPSWEFGNHPRERVSWYEAVAFCRWLTARLTDTDDLDEGLCVRLPTEWEWQQAATGGEPGHEYPWGARDYDHVRANVNHARLGRTTAAGAFPDGASKHGLCDMAGNLWEWCLNRDEDPSATGAATVDGSGSVRVLRGGSWGYPAEFARCGYRFRRRPDVRDHRFGFRACCSSPIE